GDCQEHHCVLVAKVSGALLQHFDDEADPHAHGAFPVCLPVPAGNLMSLLPWSRTVPTVTKERPGPRIPAAFRGVSGQEPGLRRETRPSWCCLAHASDRL